MWGDTKSGVGESGVGGMAAYTRKYLTTKTSRMTRNIVKFLITNYADVAGIDMSRVRFVVRIAGACYAPHKRCTHLCEARTWP